MSEEQEKTLAFYQKQLTEIKSATNNLLENVKITCPDCGKEKWIMRMYRCYMCGLFICEACAPIHFGTGKRPTIFNEVKS